MSDDLQKRGPPDRNRVDVSEDHELRYWSQKFGVSADELKAAVGEVGPMVADVERRLKQAPR